MHVEAQNAQINNFKSYAIAVTFTMVKPYDTY